MVAAHEGKHKDLVKFISGQTCLQERHVYKLVAGLTLEKEVLPLTAISERPQPTIFAEALDSPNPKDLAKQAIEEGWTAQQTRQIAGQRSVPGGARHRQQDPAKMRTPSA